MREVLFYIPLQSWFGVLGDIPIYGYGAMLFLAFVLCLWLSQRLGRREGIPGHALQDLAVWLFVFGILGARITYVIQYRADFPDPLEQPLAWFLQFIKLWDGGLVFYGSVPEPLVGYLLAYVIFLRRYNTSTWKMADVIAPCAALGLCLGRVGCLLNGCCYGNVACADCPAIEFPRAGQPLQIMVKRGYQTAAGFTVKMRLEGAREVPYVDKIEPHSPAQEAGLKLDDVIVKVDGQSLEKMDLTTALLKPEPRGKNDLQLTVQRVPDGLIDLKSYIPWTIGLHPTQIYESISMALLLFFLVSYYPFKRRDGSVMVLFMVGYGVHRFLNEMLRTDTQKVAFDMTLSQNISVIVLVAAALLAILLWRRPPSARDLAGTPPISASPPPADPALPTISRSATGQ